MQRVSRPSEVFNTTILSNPRPTNDIFFRIYSKIAKLKMLGTPPLALLRITHPLALHFIDMCLRSDPNERPTADELRRHPFLEKTADYDDDEVILGTNWSLCSLLCRSSSV